MSKFGEGSVGNDAGGISGGSGEGASSVPEAAQIEAQIATDNRVVARRRQNLTKTVKLAGASPVEAQIAFIKGLIDNPAEARKFTSSPKDYAVDHGVLLDPDVVREVANGLLFDVNVDGALMGKLGGRAAQDFLDMRSNASVAAVPAAVVAGAAVVAAAAAVVEAVVTVVRTSKISDLAALKGLGPNGIRMPGGGRFSM
ncbi:hypothetical protein [Arenibaculum sp.]|jgi:hypothetical protein|uniref:hypothetical protein n=1 Tax=Arenibaculum sp. TaxID=2865862 RepID=UPI002E113043|nr:hypothetical protein [Arenibaculum sp.]